MKQFFNTILDGLTFRDLAGHRQPRAFTIMALAILVLLILTGTYALFQRHRMMRPVQATPVAVSVTEEVPVQTSESPVEKHPVTCPADPAEWSLADAAIHMNYKTIQPACVYAGLERTIAWALAVRSGYSRAEAARLLGLAEFPMTRLNEVTIQTETKGPQDVPVSFIPPHPDLTEWRVDERGVAAIAYGLRGCFRTSSVVGNRLEVWGGDYPVVCVVAEDAENTFTVYALDGHIYTSSATPTRSYLLFGYAGDDLWVWLGTQENPKVQIEDPDLSADERATVAALFDSHPWDGRWLETNFGMVQQPLPENWQAQTDQAESQAILNLLNAYLQGVSQ
jgi:hypothetical protein